MRVVFLSCLFAFVGSFFWSPNKGLPGISKDEKIEFKKGELFKYRNEMMRWYCTESKMDKVPCKVFSQLKQVVNNRSEEDQDSFDFDQNNNLNQSDDKKVTITHYREMFLEFCNNAKTENADKICSLKVFKDKYTPQGFA